MEERYSEQELEEAKAYLRDRLRNERSMAADVESLLTLWAGYLLGPCTLPRYLLPLFCLAPVALSTALAVKQKG